MPLRTVQRTNWLMWFGVVAVLFTGSHHVGAQEPAPEFSTEAIEFFELNVRPLLVEHCYECHSADASELQAGLRLDSRAAMLDGGDSGSAMVPHQPEESLLIDAVRYQTFEMPPAGKLSDQEIAQLVRWMELGAPWPAEESDSDSSSQAEEIDWSNVRSGHWAWQPVERPSLPEVRDTEWAINSIDQFVLARLEAAELQPAPVTEPRILVRRIYLDLIGILPTPEQSQAFIDACSIDHPAAVSELVDELLASPLYGQRWARHWLDVARYSDGYGGFLDNQGYEQAWRYRDWVVDALNADLPYDQFLKLQIAGDLISPETDAVATGFFALGPTYVSDGGDPESTAQARGETLDDRLDTLGRGLMGITISCARCHDHKFDPIPQSDYYSLAGVFNNTSPQEFPLEPAEVVQQYQDHQHAIAQQEQKIRELEAIPAEQRTAEQQQQMESWKAELESLRQSAPAKFAYAHALTDSGSGDMHVALRGNLQNAGDVAPRRFLRLLDGEAPELFTEGSGRLALAEAVTSTANPLTARVFVNRVWMHHFAQPLVHSPSNFGTLGQAPTHPLLLDWLTAEFIESGWSIKTLHRRMMTSASYQMSSRFDQQAFDVDGGNELLWRMNPRRMDVEAWRDSLLAVTGELDSSSGGPSIDNIGASTRRTLYAKVSRNGDQFASDEFLRRFDFPLMRATVEERPTTVVPQQFLFLMNSPFIVDRARALVNRLANEPNDEARIRQAYQLLYGRIPTDDEVQIGLDFVSQPAESEGLPSWVQYAQVLLGSNEFMYVR